MHGYFYMLASRKRGTIYCGVTRNLSARIHTHKEGLGSKFVGKYGVKRLVYYEQYNLLIDAIKREKQVKGWQRAWKIALIEKVNPNWSELFGMNLPWE